MAADPERSENLSPTQTLDQQAGEPEGCRIHVLTGSDRGSVFDLAEGAVVIGTSKHAGWTLSDPTISGKHFSVSIVPGGMEVTDLDSTNGVHYLGTRISKAVLQHGATLTIGRTRLRLGSREPAPGPDFSSRLSYGAIVGASPIMRKLYAVLEKIESVDYTVLIQGPTGSGKELVAREIHNHSQRASSPLTVFDCGAVPANLAESALFGHVRGAFTGAVTSQPGVFQKAHRGTVFLDEIGELPLDLQPKLLRILETREVQPIGGQQGIPVDVRVIAATNRDLAEEVEQDRFRQDLYYRLNVLTVNVPALAQRREDIPDLVQAILENLGRLEMEISSATMELFTSAYDWPGNVRELRNAIARVISLGVLPESIASSADGAEDAPPVAVNVDEPFHRAKKRIVDAFEREYFLHQLERSNNNVAQAARLSGVDRSYFARMLKRHGLPDSQQPRATDDDLDTD